MKKLLNFLTTLCLIGILWSCSELQEPMPQNTAQSLSIRKANGTSPNVAISSDVSKVIQRVKNDMEATERRSRTNSNNGLSSRTGYSLSSISDANGSPLIYVANFVDNRGFVLISATKDFDPVLAYSPTGSFPISGHIAPPLEAWKQGTMNAISQAESLPDSIKNSYQEKWNLLMCNGVNPNISLSSASTAGNMRDDLWQNQVADWMHAGYIVHMLTESNITGNEQIDELMREYAQDGVYYQYDWRTHAAVVESTPSDGYSFNLVQSVWEQDNGYNDSCPVIGNSHAVVGCGPVAMGQIMRYHQFPNTFNWSNMPYANSTSTTAQFLHQIGVACQASYGTFLSGGTSTTINDVKTALNNYGYHATLGAHNKSRVINNLKNGHPVYMRGDFCEGDNEVNSHAWIASGCENSSSHRRYELFVMESPTILTSAYVYETDFQYSDTYIYMNWGWGPNGGNGYFKDGYELNHAAFFPPVYPISNRMNIYDIYPNK